jgi:hypothetical protein
LTANGSPRRAFLTAASRHSCRRKKATACAPSSPSHRRRCPGATTSCGNACSRPPRTPSRRSSSSRP